MAIIVMHSPENPNTSAGAERAARDEAIMSSVLYTGQVRSVGAKHVKALCVQAPVSVSFA